MYTGLETRIILALILKEECVGVLGGLIWFRAGSIHRPVPQVPHAKMVMNLGVL
jgi:hypothetical protein